MNSWFNRQRWQAMLKSLVSTITGEPQPDAGRVLESIIPVAGLYGVDFGNFDPQWFRDAASR